MYTLPRQEPELYDGPKQETETDKSALLEDRAGRRGLGEARESFLNGNKSVKPRHERTVYITRLYLRLLSLLMSAVILGLLIHTLIQYYQTKNWRTMNEKTHMTSRIWPISFTLHPSYMMLGAATVATVLSIIVALASLSKAVCIFSFVLTIYVSPIVSR